MLSGVFMISIGACSLDMVTIAEALPGWGDTVYGIEYDIRYGGRAANQAIAAVKLGATVHLIGKIGDDENGEAYLQKLTEAGVKTDELKTVPSVKTGITQTVTRTDCVTQTVIVPGANSHVNADEMTSGRVKRLIELADVGLFQLEVDLKATMQAMDIMRQEGRGLTILQCAPVVPSIDERIYTLADVMVVSEAEVFGMVNVDIVNDTDLRLAFERLLQLGSKTVIITRGRNGAAFVTAEDPNDMTYVPAPEIDQFVDKSGAGDAFCGALAFAFLKLKNLDLYKKVTFACQAAAFCVSRNGIQDSFASEEHVQQFLEVVENC